MGDAYASLLPQADKMLEVEEKENEGEGSGMKNWEKDYARSLALGMLDGEPETDVARQHEERAQSQKRLNTVEGVRKGMIRYLWLVLDASQAMREADFKPTRLDVATQASIAFTTQFFVQNPLSHLGVMVVTDGKVHRVTEMSGNKRHHLDSLHRLGVNCEGRFSLQNVLEVTRRSLSRIPSFGSREVLLVLGSIHSSDAGDVLQAVQAMHEANIRCSVVSLAPEMYVCRRLTSTSGGTFSVAMDEGQVFDLLSKHCPPPPLSGQSKLATLVRMGFPVQCVHSSKPSLCECHRDLKSTYYTCPRCKLKYCDLPSDCKVCATTLVSSAHLARSYHHLFPVPTFEVVKPVAGSSPKAVCCGCSCVLEAERQLQLRCPRCKGVFCVQCDIFVHEVLHNCPGCEGGASVAPS